MAGFMDKIKKFVGSDDLEDEYDDYEEEAVVEKQPKSVGESYARNAGNKLAFEKEKSNVVTMPNISRFLISIREPITFDDGTQVLDDVLKGLQGGTLFPEKLKRANKMLKSIDFSTAVANEAIEHKKRKRLIA